MKLVLHLLLQVRHLATLFLVARGRTQVGGLGLAASLFLDGVCNTVRYVQNMSGSLC